MLVYIYNELLVLATVYSIYCICASLLLNTLLRRHGEGFFCPFMTFAELNLEFRPFIVRFSREKPR